MTAPAPRRRIVMVAPFPPRHDARHGGARALAAITASVAARHDVLLLCLRDAEHAPIDAAIAGACVGVEEVPHTAAVPLREKLRRAAAPIVGVPRWVSYTSSSLMRARLDEVRRTFRPDIVQFEYHVMAQYAAVFEAAAIPRILTEYEPGTLAADEHMSRPAGVWDLRAHLERRAWRLFAPHRSLDARGDRLHRA